MTPKRRIIPVFVPHAGCTHDCVFCDQRRISGASGSAIDDVALLGHNFGSDTQPSELAFYGGSFTAIPIGLQNDLLEAAQPFLKLNHLNSIRISTRPDCIDASIIDRLRYYGIATIELGAQSMCDDVLDKSRRGHTSGDVERAAAMIKNSGLALILQMMTGLPGDTREKSLYTARRFTELKPDGVRVYPTVVVRGTYLHAMWERGEYREHTVECAVEICAEIHAIFNDAAIPIIRMGLNPTRTLDAGDAVAGAYHPAFGELVYSRVYYNKAEALLEGVAPDSNITLVVPCGHVSMMIGQHRRNINELVRKFSLCSIKVIQADFGTENQIRVAIHR
ncbi:MAG: radical SAM protein [Oscillospiraceae bacterium]|nr:radical SAM protein [Oscillospiraceae bacterium]